MQLFYSEHINKETKSYTFTREESKHIVRVLRKRIGDTIHITNGKGALFMSSVIDENPNKCSVSIDQMQYHPPPAYKLHIAVAPTKGNDRFEWFLEKATEMGISEITPLLCEHSERKSIKWERYNKILQSALKQSLQYHLPKLNHLITYDEFIATTSTTQGLKCIAHCREGNKTPLNKVLASEQEILILIGPEGDFSQEEILKATKLGVKEIALSHTRLRTETAAIWACCNVAIHKTS